MAKSVDGNTSSLRILTIAAYYPPSSAAAAIRARNIVRNLRELGHDVVVITARTNDNGTGTPPTETHPVAWLDIHELAKSRLRASAPHAGAAAEPAPYWQKSLRTLAARVIVPDLHAPWIPPATVRASHFVGASDLVVSTGAASAHVVARLVRRGRPWIADINDLWWRSPHRKAGVVRKRIDWHVERGIVASATALTVPNDALGAEIHARFGRAPATVFTGFDRSEFNLPTDTAPTSTREIVFAGTLYADFPLSVLLETLARGRDGRGWSSSKIRAVFIGTGAGDAVSEARRYGVDEFVDAVPAMPRRDLLRRLGAADALLFPLYPSDPHHLPMRFFDFVGSARPMIGVGSAAAPGAKMIERHSLGVVCSSADELLSVLDDLVRTGRGADLPPQMQGVFELGSARPALQEVLERVTARAP
jgi:glycosyltransferase involved in cell wall biosynthesis